MGITSATDEKPAQPDNSGVSVFPRFNHTKHGPIINVNRVVDEHLTFGQRIADAVANGMGSWPFIICQSCLLAAWIVLNIVSWFNHWDPYPFILMNLALSCQAAYAAPIIMMSQNRQAAKDRLMAENDFKTDKKGEEEIRHIMEHLDHQDTLILRIVQHIEAQTERLERLDTCTLDILKQVDAEHQTLAQQRQELLERINALVPSAKAKEDAS